MSAALFSELLSRVEGDALESNIRRAVESGLMRPEEHGRKAGYVIDRDHADAGVILGEFSRLNGEGHEDEVRSALPSREEAGDEDESVTQGDESESEPSRAKGVTGELPKARRRRGRRGGRGRHKPPAAAAS